MQNVVASTRNRVAAVVGMVFLSLAMALPASAQESGGEAAVNSAVSDGVSTATSVVTTNIPLILGVAALFVALKFGKRLLSKI